MREALILCESASCNAGRSAADRESALVPARIQEQFRGDAEKQARSIVSQQLALTPHVRVSGVDRWGRTRWACTVCEHERVYGTIAESWREGPYS
jgi:hypothetical protein